MNRKRLERCAALLEALPPEKQFDLKVWYEDIVHPPPGEVKEVSCNTVACAVGYCALDPWFQEQGLKLISPLASASRICLAEPRYRGLSGFNAVRRFFGIGHGTAAAVFSPSGYDEEKEPATPQGVADKIRTLLATGEAYDYEDDETYTEN